MKYSKSKFFTPKVTNNEQFWRKKFMQVLEAMYNHEATWAQPHWEQYGINPTEALMIEKEFEKQQKWRAEREKSYGDDHFEEV